MLIDLSDVLSEYHKPIETNISIEMSSFKTDFGTFNVVDKNALDLSVKHVKNRGLVITGKTNITLEIPCDRCLEEVPVCFELDFVKNIDLSSDENQAEELDEKNYIDGFYLDVEKLLYNEILIGWPMKILCKEDCKGICNTCGQNLNKTTCDCEDTSLDPRMSVIRDVFKNFKEV